MIDSRDNLSKAAFAQYFDNFKSVQDLILSVQNVVAIFVIVISLSFCRAASFKNVTRVIDCIVQQVKIL